jgi:hypothetical protein
MKKMFLLLAIGATVSSTLISCSKDKNNDVTPVVDTNTIVTYSNVSFSLLNVESGTLGRFFSTATGKSYKKSQFDGPTIPKVDLAFSNLGKQVCFFLSLDDSRYFSIPTATKTKIINYPNNLLKAADFDAMTNDAKLKGLLINASDDNSFSTSNLPAIVLFKNAAGKTGAIKIKAFYQNGNEPFITADIKVQK